MVGGQLKTAANLGDTFSRYLQMSNRIRERDAWVQMLREAMAEAGFTAEAAQYEREHAWTLLTQGEPQGAIEKLQTLIERLRQCTEFDPAFQLALSARMLGEVLLECGASTQAIPVLREAVGLWEQPVERAGGQPWKPLLASPDYAKAGDRTGNLSSTLGSLANALRSVGQHGEALELAENGLTIHERLGDHGEAAVGHGQWASILLHAAASARLTPDTNLQLPLPVRPGTGSWRECSFNIRGASPTTAVNSTELPASTSEALQLFQEAGNTGAMMRTYRILGVTDRKLGRVAEARSWYEKSRELAIELKDRLGMRDAAQNIGVVFQTEGEAARKRGDEGAARRQFAEARHWAEECRQICHSLEDEPNEAKSLVLMASILMSLGELDGAQEHAFRGLAIDERLGITRQLPFDYNILSEIAAARGDNRSGSRVGPQT